MFGNGKGGNLNLKDFGKNKEAREFMQMFDDTMKEHPADNILVFVCDKKHGQSARMLMWSIVMAMVFMKNQLQDRWVFEEPSAEEALLAMKVLAKLVEDLREYI